jgi:hypothetical protein
MSGSTDKHELYSHGGRREANGNNITQRDIETLLEIAALTSATAASTRGGAGSQEDDVICCPCAEQERLR